MLLRYPVVNRFSWDFSPVQICKKADSEHLYLKDTARAAGNSWRLAEGIAAASFAPKHAWQKTPTKSRPSVWNSRASNWNSLNCWPLFFLPTRLTDKWRGFFSGGGYDGKGPSSPNSNRNSSSCMTSRLNAVYFFFARMPGMIHSPGHDDRMCECQERGLLHLDLALNISMGIALKGNSSPTLFCPFYIALSWLAVAYKTTLPEAQIMEFPRSWAIHLKCWCLQMKL